MESRAAERVKLRAEREKLTAADPQGLAEAWAMIEELWSGAAISGHDPASLPTNVAQLGPPKPSGSTA